LREPAEPVTSRPSTRPSRGPVPTAKRFEEARDAIDRAFGRSRSDVRGREARDLVRELERIFGERGSWTVDLARALFDVVASGHKARKRSADHERVFWMLAGYTIRPGYGVPGDPERIGILAPLLGEGVAFGDQTRNWQQFWIACRRAAGGLGEAEQTSLADPLGALLSPEAGRKRPRGFRLEAVPEMIELASALERIAPARKASLGDAILERTWTDRDPRLRGAIGRLGARMPTYASAHYVVVPYVAEKWLDHLLRESWKDAPTLALAAAQIARRTGDRARDVSERARSEVERKLRASGAREEWIRMVDEIVAASESDRAEFFGEGLPVGLRLVEPTD
jgi:hypothetical protein